jgi:CubicO group peptidase (beta-lactamase class C family)
LIAFDSSLDKGVNVRAEIHGAADHGYSNVARAFADNFARHDELGAAVVIYVDGKKVVDLWGGIADQRAGRPWTLDTPAVVFSVTKGVLAICAYRLQGQGRLDLDAPVARYWPEFGAGGKSDITVRMLLTHQAGLSALDGDLTREEALSWDPVIRAIERQRPLWPPGSGYSYHTMTYGWLIGEVIRRITGSTPGAFLRTEICGPMGLDFWIGAPPSVIERAARLEPPLSDPDPELAAVILDWLAGEPHADRAGTASGAYAFPIKDGEVTFNAPDIQRAEVPGANGLGTADSLARMYGACVAEVDGVRLMSRAQVEDALVVRSAGRQVFGPPDRGERWGTGFTLDCAPMPLLGPRSFGHGGAGGDMAFGDAEHKVGFAYINNRMGGIGDPRATLLITALRSRPGG